MNLHPKYRNVYNWWSHVFTLEYVRHGSRPHVCLLYQDYEGLRKTEAEKEWVGTHWERGTRGNSVSTGARARFTAGTPRYMGINIVEIIRTHTLANKKGDKSSENIKMDGANRMVIKDHLLHYLYHHIEGWCSVGCIGWIIEFLKFSITLSFTFIFYF